MQIHLSWSLPFLTLGGLAAVWGQQASDQVPLKNWPAPLSWQATTSQEKEAVREKEAATKGLLSPQLQTAGGGTTLGVLVAITPCRLVDTRANMPTPYGA